MQVTQRNLGAQAAQRLQSAPHAQGQQRKGDAAQGQSRQQDGQLQVARQFGALALRLDHDDGDGAIDHGRCH